MRERLILVIPVTLLVILFLLYLNTRSIAKTRIVILVVPFSVVGALWAVYALDYSISIAVWVAIIALLGIDAETGVFMLLYLDLAYDKTQREQAEFSKTHPYQAIVESAAKRLRPKFMTFATMTIGLIPILRFNPHTLVHWHRLGNHEAHRRSDDRWHLHLFYSRTAGYPVIYTVWKERHLAKELALDAASLAVWIELGPVSQIILTSHEEQPFVRQLNQSQPANS